MEIQWLGMQTYEERGRCTHFRIHGCWVVGKLENVRKYIGEPDEWMPPEPDI
jgi:hypothetical protein